jgi:GT2 family glycosyltransferase
MKVSFIILSHNNITISITLVNQILSSSSLLNNDYEIVFVENSLESLEIIDQISKINPKLKVYRCKNMGFGHGNNFGFSKSSGNYVFFLNPDIRLNNDFFVKVDELIKKKIEVVAFRTFNEKQELNQNLFFIKQQSLLYYLLSKIFNKLNMFFYKSMFVTGCNLLISRNAFNDIGYFDENIFMFNEERDIYTRLYKFGYKLKYITKPSIIHLEKKDNSSFFIIKNSIDSLVFFCKKYNYNTEKTLIKKRNYNNFKVLVFKFLGKNSTDLITEINYINGKIKMLNQNEI